MSDEAKALKVSLLLAGLMLCVAVIPTLPNSFYLLLRWGVCGAAVYVGFKLRKAPSLSGHFIPLLIVAALFNPLMPVSLPPLLGLVASLVCAVYFLTLSKKIL